ncbi:outer membrane protein assembly factor BamD [Caulobacter sp. SL161]|uniref:outer membrane protein assembly factor BamD n=1 Tax=Caulobacter sp. SL161 TaxID=2995156 RepID=UPI002274E5E7|nr:outer membrane protein assembly factor BamD [Caulobacter sp. SL161]MCY1647950.1 outer membrane protein assembly factor BamD [Caulobacter sp. SL161]
MRESVLRIIQGRPAVMIAAVLVAASVAGCAGKAKKPTLVYEERPVELLYSTGADRLDRGNWNEAVDYFREVERQHPYSEWSRRSILMTGYAHYMGNQYAEAIGDADRFISLYPGNPSAQYAFYLKAICYFEQIVDVNRDQAATEQALAALRDVVQRYPNTEYATDARLKIDMVNDQLAGKEMAIGRWYLKNGQTLAAIGRFKAVIERHQTTSHTPEALFRLVEAYLTIGLNEEAKRNGAVLGYNFPGDRWYVDAYRLLNDNGLRPAVEPLKAGAKRNALERILSKDKEATLAPPGERKAKKGLLGPLGM